MTSQINPNNIDGAYPIAGQPNDTQGFRNNFTATKTNFTYAANEITELQAKAVLKEALTGTTLDNNLGTNPLYNYEYRQEVGTLVQLVSTAGTVTLDWSAGSYQTLPSTTGSITLAFANWPITGKAAQIAFRVTISSTAYTMTLPAAVSLGTTGLQGLSGSIITFGATGTYDFVFTTIDGGTTITIIDITRPRLNSNIAPMGYASGTGNSATQSTNKSNPVVLNSLCGQITMDSASLSAAAEVSFTLTNNKIAATDVVYVCIASGATAGAYNVQVDAVAAGSCRISVGNMSTGPLSEAIVLNFVVIKSVAA